MATPAKPGFDREYQEMVREGAWSGILRAITDPETRRADLREEDIMAALIDLQAVVLSSTEDAKSSIALRDRIEAAGKRLRLRATEARERDEAKALFKNVARQHR